MLSISPTYLLYFLPLLIAISVVYGGTRHEDTGTIIHQSIHTGLWVLGFMAVIFVIILFMGWWL
jgi:hypothetical protein